MTAPMIAAAVSIPSTVLRDNTGRSGGDGTEGHRMTPSEGSDTRQGAAQRPWRTFFGYFRPQLGLFWADTFCAIVQAAVDLAFPLILRSLTEGLFAGPAEQILGALWIIGLGLVAMYAVRYVCRWFISKWGHIMGARIESAMREDLFDQYERLSFSYYDRHDTGDLSSRLVNDLFDISEAAHHGPEWIVVCGLEIVGSFCIMFAINWQLALAMAVVTFCFAAYNVGANHRMRAIFDDNRRKISGVNVQLTDALAGTRVVKSFANESLERAKFRTANDAFLDSKARMYGAMGAYQAMAAMLSGILYTIIIVFGGWLVATRAMGVEDLATYALYVSLFIGPIETLINFTEMFQKARAGFARFLEILSTKPDVEDAPGAPDIRVTEGAVRYEDVWFSYEEGEPVLQGLDLSLEPGVTYALVGPSGAGKSTTCALLPRFYDVDRGRITIDGQDVRSVTQESLRRAIGIVQQDVYLFNGSIAANIAYGRPDATADEIVEAAKRAQIHDYVASLPDGYDTVVGERGSHLSGGQRQRIAIARVFLKDPKLLVLDEATSALDNESERAVQRSLFELARGRTTLIIAHRLSTIRGADVICAMEDGRVVERGTHAELLAKGGLYARYHAMYADGVMGATAGDAALEAGSTAAFMADDVAAGGADGAALEAKSALTAGDEPRANPQSLSTLAGEASRG